MGCRLVWFTIAQICIVVWAVSQQLVDIASQPAFNDTNDEAVDVECLLQTDIVMREQTRTQLLSSRSVSHDHVHYAAYGSRRRSSGLWDWWDSLTNTVSNAAASVGQYITSLKDALVQKAIVAFSVFITLPGEYEAGAEIGAGGSTTAVVNVVFFVAIGIVIVCAACGHYVDVYVVKWAPQPGRPSAAVFATFIASYTLLIPGLFSTLFSFNVVIDVFGKKVAAISDEKGNPIPLTESAVGLVHDLFETGAITGAILLITYAVIVPVAKLGLIACGEYWRFSSDPSEINRSYVCIRCIQLVSKWASPDMFAYILIWYLVKSMDGALVQAYTQLDVGFICFSLFCILTTVSSLAIPLPERAVGPICTKHPLPAPFELRFVVVILGFISAVLLGAGIRTPCLGLRLDTSVMMDELLAEMKKTLPDLVIDTLQPTIEQYVADLQDQVSADVSLYSCMKALLISDGLSASFILAFLLLAGFAVFLPVLNIFVLVAIATHWSPADFFENASARRLLDLTHALSHVSMLDVLVMGIFIVVWAGAIYEEKGIILSLHSGFFLLLGAELAHYAASILALQVSGLS